jgi:hypothetical protein
LVDSHTNEWLSPKCGDRYQHIRVRWVQSKEQKLNKPHRREILCRDRFSMQITSEDTDDTERAQMTQISSDRHRMQQREVSLAHNLLE